MKIWALFLFGSLVLGGFGYQRVHPPRALVALGLCVVTAFAMTMARFV